MRRRIALLAILCGCSAPGWAAAQAGDLRPGPYQVDPTRSSLQAVTHVLGGATSVALRFRVRSGTVLYAPLPPDRSEVSLAVDARDVEGGGAAGARAAAASLQSDRYPVITFVSQALDLRGAAPVDVVGELSLRGVTRPVRLAVAVAEAEDPRGIRVTGTGHIRRSAFAVPAAAPFTRDVVDLRFDVTFLPP